MRPHETPYTKIMQSNFPQRTATRGPPLATCRDTGVVQEMSKDGSFLTDPLLAIVLARPCASPERSRTCGRGDPQTRPLHTFSRLPLAQLRPTLALIAIAI